MPLKEPPRRPLRSYRFVWMDRSPNLPVTNDTRVALERLACQLEEVGCQIARLGPPELDFGVAGQVFRSVVGFELGPRLPTGPRWMIRVATGLTGGDWHVRGLAQRDALIATIDHFLAEWDAWLCPAACLPAFPHCEPGMPMDVDGHRRSYMTATTGYTAVFSVTDNPVVVLPVAKSADGLPIGVQVVGRPWHDMELLNVAEALTEVTGESHSPPGF